MLLYHANVVDLYNSAVRSLIQEMKQLSQRNIIQNMYITGGMIHSEVERMLKELNKTAFQKNMHCILIDGDTPINNVLVEYQYETLSQETNYPLVFNSEFRNMAFKFNITIPTSIALSNSWEKIKNNSDEFKHITFVNIHADYYTTVMLLNDMCPICIEPLKFNEKFDINSDLAVVISPYDLYCMRDTGITFKITEKLKGLLKTRVDRVLSSIIG